MDGVSNKAAVEAFHGTEKYIHLGEWSNIDEQKIVVFRGEHADSTCYVIDDKGIPRQGVSARSTVTKGIHVLQGERVHAMEAYIRFKPTTE